MERMVGKKLVLCEVIMHGAIVVDGSESVSRVCPRLDLPIHTTLNLAAEGFGTQSKNVHPN